MKLKLNKVAVAGEGSSVVGGIPLSSSVGTGSLASGKQKPERRKRCKKGYTISNDDDNDMDPSNTSISAVKMNLKLNKTAVKGGGSGVDGKLLLSSSDMAGPSASKKRKPGARKRCQEKNNFKR